MNTDSMPSPTMPAVNLPSPTPVTQSAATVPPAPMSQSMAAPIQPTMPATPKKSNKMLPIAILVIVLIALLAVGGAYVVLKNQLPAANSTTNTTNVTTETNTTTTTVEQTPVSTAVSTDTTYKQVAPDGWTIDVELDGDVAFALPPQDNYTAKQPTTSLSVDEPKLWYVSNPTNSMYAPNTVNIYKTPGGYDRSNFACGIGCVKESFITVTRNASTQTTDELYAKLKADADVADAEPNSYYALNPGSDPAVFNPVKINKWGQDVIKYQTRGSGDSPERSEYVLGTGTNAYYIDFFSTNNDADALSVLESLVFK